MGTGSDLGLPHSLPALRISSVAKMGCDGSKGKDSKVEGDLRGSKEADTYKQPLTCQQEAQTAPGGVLGGCFCLAWCSPVGVWL